MTAMQLLLKPLVTAEPLVVVRIPGGRELALKMQHNKGLHSCSWDELHHWLMAARREPSPIRRGDTSSEGSLRMNFLGRAGRGDECRQASHSSCDSILYRV